jgi:hypothetical protein
MDSPRIPSAAGVSSPRCFSDPPFTPTGITRGPQPPYEAITGETGEVGGTPRPDEEIVGDRRPGAPLRFVSAGGGSGGSFAGQMLVFDPPEVVEFTWGTDLLRIELRQDGPGTLLTLTDTFDDVGKAARDAAGWHECLDRLVSDLDGTAQPSKGERWREIHPVYVAELGPEASTIGPPAGLP